MCDAWNPERQAMIMGKGAWQKEHVLEHEAIAAERAAEREQRRREHASTDHDNRQHQEEE